MTKTKSTKQALLMSVLALVLCFAMLLGTTFAWFTDSVTSAGNKIMSGTLKVDLELLDKESGTWNSIKEDKTALFNNDKWEPGYTEVKMLKVENEGTLALKWKAKFVSEKELSILADVIDVYVLPYDVLTEEQAKDVAYPTTRDLEAAGYKKVGTVRDFVNTIETTTTGKLEAGESAYLGIALKMQESANNDYQGKDLGAFDIMILAAQLDSEEDGFGKDYDANAEYQKFADKWDGTVDTSWYNDTDTEFTLSTAEALAGLAKLVDAGNTFEGKTIKLVTDLDLYAVDANGQRVSFDPIGYGYNVVFKGTFDGNSKTISNLYQNGWALGLDYSTEGGGLFASVVDATIKDVTIDKAEIVMECIDMGAVVGYSYGNCTYENITVKDSIVANYNRYTGGVVGEVNGTQTFKNVDVIDTTISALWGTYDASVGGIIGGKWGEANITFEDCDVSAQLDVFNDSCSNYQYYNYRLSGMLIGMSEEVTNGVATASYLTCINCTVTYGDWVNYTYCESESYGKGSYASEGEWKFKRVQAGYATDGVDPNHTHDTDESHEELMVFDQLFGGDKGVKGGKTHDGVTVVYPTTN